MSYSQLLNQVINGDDLSHESMLGLMHQVMSGELTHAQIAALIVALRIKGETVDEISAAATVMRELSAKVNVADRNHLIDTCGTGGDGIQTFNVSTACAFVAAAAGAKVAKHGGRSVSSTCGSADVLESLGVNVHQTAAQVAHCVDTIGLGFMFAPNHHSAMKHSASVRRVRTLFNLLGPLTNPANANRQLLGVFSSTLTGKLARVMQKLGSEHVMVVCGADGMDELSFSGDSFVAELNNGEVKEYIINPQQFGLELHALSTIQVRNAEESKAMLLGVLTGQLGPARDIVLLNAGAAIYVADLVPNLAQGIVIAASMLDSGNALQKLNQLITMTNA